MADAAPTTIRVEVSDGVATVTLNRPETLNALNAAMRTELLAAFKGFARDDAVRAVILTGEGRGFCSGADLRGGSDERDFRRVLEREYNPLVRGIRDLPKPVIAAVNGVAAGAGVSLALACDLVYASEEARFIQAFVRIGLVPDSGSTRTLVRALGRHRASQLIFTGEPLSALDAQAGGLVTVVVPGDELMATVHDAATRLAAAPTRAIGLAKRAINAAEDEPLEESLAREAQLQELAGRTEDHAEGVAAFAEKREPRFVGR
ncbi:MAG TPA: enoyl-CoA hydratase-related protein [Candidatus Limnocylindria bacterium]|jgi:2-(1,2-epoxy-1,2-dihydrophenyl)acetyl-CoA isomerase|nr:enoyl-CoA hydratase-related protein [Candidatus Limnocylindria bacterium]